MRDPGTPRRNPFFEYADPDEPTPGGPDDRGSVGGADAAGWLLGALGELVDALVDAQPEASEHLVAAAHELVLAVKTVVDATEAALAAQRSAMATAAAAHAARTRADGPSGPPEKAETAADRTVPLRRVDLA